MDGIGADIGLSGDGCAGGHGHRARSESVLPQALLLLAAMGLASAAPSTPGYVGIYQFVVVTVLAPFGFSRSAALAYMLVLQAATYLVVIAWGSLGWWRLGVRGITE